ncbi:hypothetical protein REX01_003413 [Klebsiella aerogenes]|nr:hypothetical protein [Klebsiella aerogenes]
MRIFVAVFICFILSPIAYSQELAHWKYPNGVPSLSPLNAGAGSPRLALAITNLDDFTVSILDLRIETDPDASCYIDVKNAPPSIRDISPAKINGKFVKMVSICLGNGGVITPKTKEGRAYLKEVVMGGDSVDIYLTDKVHIEFPASDINEMKRKASELSSAM